MLRVTRGLLTIMAGIGVMTPTMHAAEFTNNQETVFVMTNAADKNEVIAFSRAHDGSFNEGPSIQHGWQRKRRSYRSAGSAGLPDAKPGSLILVCRQRRVAVISQYFVFSRMALYFLPIGKHQAAANQ